MFKKKKKKKKKDDTRMEFQELNTIQTLCLIQFILHNKHLLGLTMQLNVFIYRLKVFSCLQQSVYFGV